MTLANNKITQFVKKVVDLADTPSENMSSTDIKAWFDSSPEELRVKFNALIDDLTSATVGGSGAKNIGVSPIAGLTGADVETLLNALKTQVDTKTGSSGDHLGSWQGLTPQMIGAPEMNSARITSAELEIAKKAKQYVIDVQKDYGAKGDGVTDDTIPIRSAIAYAETLAINRFLSGVVVFFPKGTYLISGTLTVTKSNVKLKGESFSSTVIYAPASTFDLVHFNGTSLALYSVAMDGIRTYTPYNATAGNHIRLTRCINSHFDFHMVGSYDGLAIDGCGKLFFKNVHASQENRDTGLSRYGLDFLDENGINSDIHIDNLQIVPNIAMSSEYTMSIRSCDGLYFGKAHLHGGLLVQPNNIGNGQTCASVFFDTLYLDSANENNLLFTGSANAYRNFQINNLYLRGAKNGLVFNTTSLVSRIIINNYLISGQQFSGVDCKNSLVSELIFGSGICSDNNISNVASYGDMLLQGVSVMVNGITLKGGGAAGYGVYFKSGLSKSSIGMLNATESTATNKFVNSGSANKIGLLNGVVAKTRGSAVVVNGTTSIIVTHGVGVPITGENISVTPRASLSGGGSFWISNVTATTFTINMQTAPTVSVTFTWGVDATG